MTVALVFPDAEVAMVELLEELTPDPRDVGVAVPEEWTPGSDPYLLVGQDGVGEGSTRLVERPLVRVTVFADGPTLAKQLAREAHARLLAHDGSGEIHKVKRGTGIFPARDQATGADLASFTVRLTVRSTPLT